MKTKLVVAAALALVSGCYTPPCEDALCDATADAGAPGGGTGGAAGGGTGGSVGGGTGGSVGGGTGGSVGGGTGGSVGGGTGGSVGGGTGGSVGGGTGGSVGGGTGGGSVGGGTGGSVGGGTGGSFGGGTGGGGMDAGMETPDGGADAGCVTPPSGLVSWWPAEGNALDVVGPNSGTINSGVTFVPGRVGQAFRFDGNDGRVSATAVGLPTGASDRAIELWVRIDQSTNDQPFFAGYGGFGTQSASYQVGTLRQTGNAYFSQWGQALVGVPIPLSTWTHVVATTQGSVTYLYLNGVVSAAGVLPLNTSAGSAFDIGRITGSTGNTERLNGAVDEVSVYNRALTAAEIASLAAAPLGKCR